MNPMPETRCRCKPSAGFTLVELLVTILIIAILAALSFMGVNRMIENGRKVQTLAIFRDFTVGMTMFESDYTRPPVPTSKRDTGWDTIYGDPGGFYSNKFLVSVLAGEDKDYPFGGENFTTSSVNPREESYMIFPLAPDGKNGVGTDGILYDAWGFEIMVAINGLLSNNPEDELVDFNGGQNDRRLHTWGLAEYVETKPDEQSFVLWSYGKDNKKGDDAESYGEVVPLKGSGDVISW